MAEIEVYFYVLPQKKPDYSTARRRATMATIEKLGAAAIVETKLLVSNDQIDSEGFVKEP